MEHERLQGSSNGRDEGFWDFSWDEMAEYDLEGGEKTGMRSIGKRALLSPEVRAPAPDEPLRPAP